MSPTIVRLAELALVLAAALSMLAPAGAAGPPQNFPELQRTLLALDAYPVSTAKHADDPASLRQALEQIATAVLDQSAARLGTGVRDSLVLASLHISAHGPFLAQFRQRVDGADVIGAHVDIVIDRQLRPRALSGQWALPVVASGQGWALAPVQAGRVVLSDLALPPAALKAGSDSGSDGDWIRLAAGPRIESMRARRAWLARDDGLHPSYVLEAIAARGSDEQPLAQRVTVRASDGIVLRRSSLILHQDAIGYRVFADADGHPYVDPYGFTNPHPTGVRDGSRPTLAAPMRLIERVHGGIRTQDPWLPVGASSTVGNNVDAFFNVMPVVGGVYHWWFEQDALRFFDAGAGDHRAPLSGPRRFDFAYDVNQAPRDYFQRYYQPPAGPVPRTSPQLNAKIVQAFYASNWLHDVFYNLGFDEGSGNAQQQNFGRGGLGGDPLIVHAGASSTFAMVTDDGVSPMLVLGYNSHSLSNRDVSGFAFDVLAHEWTHVMFTRLVGFSESVQAGALNEGTADFVGMLLSVREQDGPNFAGAYAVGAYYNTDYDDYDDDLPAAGSAGVPDNTWYHGFRRFPYSANLALNPLSFRHIGRDHPLPAEWQAFDWKWRSKLNSEVHTAGEVWASALWQCAHKLLLASPPGQFRATRERVLGYLVAGLKLMPADPTYIEARDALLLAIRSDDESAWQRCARGFAERGMGAGALAPPRESIDLTGVRESFSTAEHALSITAVELVPIAGTDDILRYGERGQLRVTVVNSGLSALDDISVQAVSTNGTTRLDRSVLVQGLALAPGGTATLGVELDLLSAQGLRLAAFELTASSATTQALARENRSFRTNYELRVDASSDDAASLEVFEHSWTTAFGGFPHGCTVGCFGDLVKWAPVEHRGETAYKAGDPHIGFDAHLLSPNIIVDAASTLVLGLRHDYTLERTAPNSPGLRSMAAVEISIDGGAFVPAAPYLRSGLAHFEGTSNGWRDEQLDFGSALAGRRVQFRFRTRAYPSFAARPTFWAISRVAIQGAVAPMFAREHAEQLGVVPGHSGSWFPVGRSGEGWVVEVLAGEMAVMTWFTYPPAGTTGATQQWLLGVGRIDGNRILFDDVRAPRGARFGGAFDPATIERLPWGTLEMEFNGCDSMVVRYQGPPAVGSGVLSTTRLTSIGDLPCATAPPEPRLGRGYSGAWFDPTHDGEGWFLQEIDAANAALFWFSYTPAGDPAWMTGLGRWQDSHLRVDDLLITRGTAFGDGFDPAAVVREHWGSLDLHFLDCNRASLSWQALDPGYGAGVLAPVRLTQLAGSSCVP